MSPTNNQHEVYFTFERFGLQVKVIAIDSLTKKEVVVIVPYTLPQKDMEALALKKLKYVTDKEKNAKN